MPGIREVFALNLRLARQAAGVSQEELAHRAGLDRTYVSSMERCVYAASIDVVDRVATALDVQAADLLRRPGAVPVSVPWVGRK
jgi:transcriptional regulator with XRE-family HTH domain